MPQYVITAYDGTDEGAMERRMKVRQAHMDLISQMRKEGKVLCGLALIDANEKMIGSTVICNMKDRAELDAWLATEPYVTGKVWEKIEVKDAKLAPTFNDLIKA